MPGYDLHTHGPGKMTIAKSKFHYKKYNVFSYKKYNVFSCIKNKTKKLLLRRPGWSPVFFAGTPLKHPQVLAGSEQQQCQRPLARSPGRSLLLLPPDP